jgi:hypothetical protein
MSGECLCGAFAKPGELEMIRFFFPDTAAEIDELERKAKAAKKHCVWGTRPPRKPKGATRDTWLCFCDGTPHADDPDACTDGTWWSMKEVPEVEGEVGLLCAKCEAPNRAGAGA